MPEYTNEKTPDVGGTSGGSSGVLTDGGVNHHTSTGDLSMQQKQYTPNGGGKQADNLAAGSVEELGGTNLLDSGLRYSKRGWKIFPVDGKKEPLTKHGFKDATTDENQIEAWAARWPGANWALEIPNDLLVTDLDVKHNQNGIREFEELQGMECISSGLSTGEGLIWAVRDPIYKMKGGKQVEEDPGVSDKRHLFDEREFFNTLTVMTRAGNTLSPIMREAWDNRGILRLVTKHSPAKATGAHISVVAHITEDELRQNLSQSALMNGFANRFVFALVKRSKWLADGGGDIDPAIEHELARRIGAALAKWRRHEMTVVAMTEAAEAEWRPMYYRLDSLECWEQPAGEARPRC
jgi:hypothetical protein